MLATREFAIFNLIEVMVIVVPDVMAFKTLCL